MAASYQLDSGRRQAPGAIHLRQDGGIQSAQGWSMGGPWRESGSLPSGQGSKGLEGSWSMGWVQGKGSAKAPFPGLDEVVSMKWSGVSGAGTPLCRWVQGERSLPRVMERRYVPLAPQRAQCPEGATGRGDATGARSGPPCQDGFVLQNTSYGSSKRGHQPRCSVCSTKPALTSKHQEPPASRGRGVGRLAPVCRSRSRQTAW